MKTIKITRWHRVEDDYVDVEDGAVPSKGDRVGYAGRLGGHDTFEVRDVEWEVESHPDRGYVRVMAIVRLELSR